MLIVGLSILEHAQTLQLTADPVAQSHQSAPGMATDIDRVATH